MDYKISTIDILKAVVNSISLKMEIYSVVDNGSGSYTIKVCDMKWAQTGYDVIIGNYTYRIEEIDAKNKEITLTGDALITDATFLLYPPYFFYGTPIATATETNQNAEAETRMPMVWLRVDQTFKEKIYRDISQPKDRDITGMLFFLTKAKHKEWVTSQAFSEAIEPMFRLQELFDEQMRKFTNLFNLIDTSYERDPYTKFGVYIENKGSKTTLFADELSGCSMDMAPLSVFKQGLCDLPCGSDAEGIGYDVIADTLIVY